MTKQEYHTLEAIRIQNELDNLGNEFAEEGIVRSVLRIRIKQEKEFAIDPRHICVYCEKYY